MQKRQSLHVLVALFAVIVSAEAALAAPSINNCPILPADNIWNTAIDTLPADADSDAYVQSIGINARAHADFGSGLWDSGPIGIPYTTVAAGQAKLAVQFEYADESDPGPYPIPPNPLIEGGASSSGDRHVLILEQETCRLYELYHVYPGTDGSWSAGSGAVYDLRSHALRPAGWTSADAAGLAMLPGLVRYDEVLAGEIQHAIRFTAPSTRRAYVWPARHYASWSTDPALPPMGQRFRLKAGFDITAFSPTTRIILTALKKYGMMLADNGAAWYIGGVPDERWNNDELHELHELRGSDFEAVDVSALQLSADSGQVRTAAAGPKTHNDVDGDGRSDFVVWRPAFGLWFVLPSSAEFSYARHSAYQLGLPGDRPVAADFDGDNRTDLAVWRPADGTWYFRLSGFAYQTITAIQWGLPGDIPLTGDIDGDGRSDLIVYRAAAGLFYILRSSSGFDRQGALAGRNNALLVIRAGGPGNDPLTGDFNGDGSDEAVTVWQLIRFWSVKNAADYLLFSLPWGAPGDTPLACDWDGNGISDRVAVRINDTGMLDWYTATDSGPVYTLLFGSGGDIPGCRSDYDGDGRTDPTLFRQTSGQWFYRLSSDPAVVEIDFGLPGDIPVF